VDVSVFTDPNKVIGGAVSATALTAPITTRGKPVKTPPAVLRVIPNILEQLLKFAIRASFLATTRVPAARTKSAEYELPTERGFSQDDIIYIYLYRIYFKYIKSLFILNI
jgi:hypothetical protein